MPNIATIRPQYRDIRYDTIYRATTNTNTRLPLPARTVCCGTTTTTTTTTTVADLQGQSVVEPVGSTVAGHWQWSDEMFLLPRHTQKLMHRMTKN